MMKRNTKPLNPVLMIVFCALVGLLMLLYSDDINQGINIFLTMLGIGISAAIGQAAIIQNAIHKDNIKLQMFDKRYQILQTLLDSIALVRRDNWDRYLLLGAGDDPQYINHQIIDTEERLYNAVQLSVSLFDVDLNAKMVQVNNAYCAVSRSYKRMFVTNTNLLEDIELRARFFAIISKYFASAEELDYQKMDAELKSEVPQLYMPLYEFSQNCEEYVKLIDELKILQDFNKYVIIRDIDL